MLRFCQLLENMGRWDLLLPDPVLKELMLDKLLNRYLMITLCSQTLSSKSAASACKKVFQIVVGSIEFVYYWCDLY